MAPRNRGRNPLYNMLPLLILLVLSTTAHAASAVLGIDLGTEYIKAAIAKPGSPIEIVLTKDSKRKEAAALAFKPSRTQINDKHAFPERLYGGDALAVSARFPSEVYQNLKSIIGLPYDSSMVQTYLARYPSLQHEKTTRSTDASDASRVAFKSQSFGSDGTFMVEELLAMELKNIKANAEATIGKGSVVSDAVITYPAFFSAEEKRAVEFAAQLAGLRVIGLISDGLAVGLNYATARTFESVNEGGKPEYNLVYDIGAGSTTATVLKFQGRTIKGPGKKNQTIQEVQVLGIGSDRTLGGDALNDLIVQDMIAKFLDSPRMKDFGVPSISVRKHGKTMTRLYKDAEKIRQVLSANSKASASFEGLYYGDMNFKYSLTRDEFEELAKDVAPRVAPPLNEALLMADLRLEDINSIILYGGVSRTPIVQKQLETVVGGSDKVRTNVNADEAAVMGAAFKAASINPTYRVKDIRAIDISGVAYTMSWSIDGKQKEQKIFVPTSQIGVEKQVTVKSQQDTKLEFKHELVTGAHDIVAVELTNLTKSVNELKDKYECVPTNITTVFTVRLNPVNGIPELSSGSVSCVAEKSKDGSVLDNVKGLFGFGSKKDQKPLQGDEEELADDPSASIPLPVSDPTSSGTIVASSSATGDSSTSSVSSSATKAAVAKPTTIVIPLASKTTVLGLNQPPTKELPGIKKRLTAFDRSDEDSVLRAEALNVLEGYTYRARDYLEDAEFAAVSTDKVRKELEKQLSAVSDWLYGDGVDAKLADFKAKLKGLQSIVDPVLKRKDEGSRRQTAIEALERGLSSASSMLDMIKSNIEEAANAATASVSSVVSEATESASSIVSGSSADASELEDDPYTTKSASSSDDADSILPKPYEYTKEDLSSVSDVYDTVKKWLEDKVAAQAKLSRYDDPAVLVADLESKASELRKTVTNLVMKQMKPAQKPKPKKTKSKKSKASATSTSTQSASATIIKDEL